MKDSEVLRQVRVLIENKSSEYICYSLDRTEATDEQKFSIRSWIYKMIAPWYSFESWFLEHHKELFKREKKNDPNCDFLRLARLAWLDWMIDYCEKEEANDKRSKA